MLAYLEVIYEDYFKKEFGEDFMLVLMSDHGNIFDPSESEMGMDHGENNEQNRNFVYVISPKFAKVNSKKLYKKKDVDIQQLAPFLSQFIKNCNIPLLSTQFPLPMLKDDFISELQALRAKEVQLIRYLHHEYKLAFDKNSPFIYNFDSNLTLEELTLPYLEYEDKDKNSENEKKIRAYRHYIEILAKKLPYYNLRVQLKTILSLFCFCVPF